MSARSCRHSACSCPVGPHELYCAPACRRAAERWDPSGGDGCDCEHQDCLGSAGKRGEERRGEELQHPPPAEAERAWKAGS